MKIFPDSISRKLGKLLTSVLAFLFVTTAFAACANPFSSSSQSGDIHKIKHVVVIMQENRSFDTYFGTYPGADGIPMQNGVPTVCVNDPLTNQCGKPFHDSADLNRGGPHGQVDATNDINGGKMDGFIQQMRHGRKTKCQGPFDPACAASNQHLSDVMATMMRAKFQTTGRMPTTSYYKITCLSLTPRGVCRSTSLWYPNGRQSARNRACQ